MDRDLSIQRMVFNRLPFLADTEANKAKIDDYTLELMYELEPCFRIDANTKPEEESKVGVEKYYTIPQRAVLADLVVVYMIMLQMIANVGGATDESGVEAGDSKFMSEATAGSVTVKWEQYDVSKGSGLIMSGEKLLQLYKKSAIRKARALGCIIDICDDCQLAVELMLTYDLPTPVVVTSGCGEPNRRRTIERG